MNAQDRRQPSIRGEARRSPKRGTGRAPGLEQALDLMDATVTAWLLGLPDADRAQQEFVDVVRRVYAYARTTDLPYVDARIRFAVERMSEPSVEPDAVRH